jgi:hypothetical protein
MDLTWSSLTFQSAAGYKAVSTRRRVKGRQETLNL